jgi:hypothetical protein
VDPIVNALTIVRDEQFLPLLESALSKGKQGRRKKVIASFLLSVVPSARLLRALELEVTTLDGPSLSRCGNSVVMLLVSQWLLQEPSITVWVTNTIAPDIIDPLLGACVVFEFCDVFSLCVHCVCMCVCVCLSFVSGTFV